MKYLFTSKTVNSPTFKDILLHIINCHQGHVCYKNGPGNGRDRAAKRVSKQCVLSVPVIVAVEDKRVQLLSTFHVSTCRIVMLVECRDIILRQKLVHLSVRYDVEG